MGETDTHNSSEIFRAGVFSKGDNAAIEVVFKRYYASFLGWLQKTYRCSRKQGIDVYCRAILVFREKTWAGAFNDYKEVHLKTLIFSIGKNVYREELRKEQRHAAIHTYSEDPDNVFSDAQADLSTEYYEQFFKESTNEVTLRLKKALEEIGEGCKKILMMRIVYGCSMNEIAEEMSFKNTDSAKTQKNKCLKKLKEILNIAEIRRE